MSDDLVERARVGAEKVYGTQFFNVEIEAAIAVALEEAAKVADRVADEAAVHCREALLDDARAIAEQCADECAGARKAAAAIRALVKEPQP